MTASLRQPDFLLINDPDKTATTFGCDQKWYAERWQRQAGCGPCTAATILYYLARSRDFLDHLYPAGSQAREDFTSFMSDIWHFVTPGHMGVNEASILADGVVCYASQKGVAIHAEIQRVPPLIKRTAPFADFANFIRAGLEQDSPVAFLNLSNGQLSNLDSWHWVTVTSLDDSGVAEISDSGERKSVDLGIWYQSSWLGGAAVWFVA